MRLRPFTSIRERRLWTSAGATLLAVYLTLWLAGAFEGELGARRLLDNVFFVGFLLLVGAAVLALLRRRIGSTTPAIAIALSGVALIVFARLGIPAAERTHLVEYGVIAALILAAVRERSRARPGIRRPAAIALGIAVGVGIVDEGVQALLPGRAADVRDIAFNALAATVVIAGAVLARLIVERRTRSVDERGHA